MRVLVTGAAGFLGAASASLLSTHHEVVRSDLAGEDMFACDLGDRNAVTALVARSRPDCILHCGAISGAMAHNPAGFFEVNVASTRNVAEAAQSFNVSRVVLASSIAVYGCHATRAPVSEAAPLLATEPYGASKIAAENALSACSRTGLETIALRISSVFGEGRRTNCLLQSAVRAWREGRPLGLARHGQVPRQLIHISDAARALALAVETRHPRRSVYNISGGSYLPEADIIALVTSRIPGLELTNQSDDFMDWPDGDIGPLAIRAAATDLGYEPKSNLAGALDSYVAALVAKSGDPISRKARR